VATHMHRREGEDAYAHDHPLREFPGSRPLGFTPHHHDGDEVFPPGEDLPIVDDDGAPV
jgi:hypothetical protein